MSHKNTCLTNITKFVCPNPSTFSPLGSVLYVLRASLPSGHKDAPRNPHPRLQSALPHQGSSPQSCLCTAQGGGPAALFPVRRDSCPKKPSISRVLEAPCQALLSGEKRLTSNQYWCPRPPFLNTL